MKCRLLNTSGLICALVFLVGPIFSQPIDQEIKFIDNDLDLAISRSASSGKMIFVDGYASWCAPCKVMDQEVFKDSMVAAFFNSNFVNLKLDMEKGAGEVAAEKYDIKAYPTFLFIDSSGSLLHKGIGYQTPKDLVSLALRARDPNTQLASLAAKYTGGNRGDNVHLAYAQALYHARDQRFDSVARAYLDTQSDWTDKATMQLVLQTAEAFGDPYYRNILKHKFLYIKAYGEGLVYGRLLHMLEQYYFEEIENVKLSEVKQQYAEIFPASKEEQFYDNFELSFYERTNKKEKYLEAAKQYVKRYPNLSWSALNGLAWNIYEKYPDEKALKLATRWAKKSIELQSNHYNNDTLAALYYKQGKEKPARKYAERAIELAKVAKADYSTTTELLERINAIP